jgi:hypothetical protein
MSVPSQRERIRLSLWRVRVAGRILFVLFFIGWVLLARFVPAPSPLQTSAQIVQRYQGSVHGIRLGATFMMRLHHPDPQRRRLAGVPDPVATVQHVVHRAGGRRVPPQT